MTAIRRAAAFVFRQLDTPLGVLVGLLVALGLTVLYSATYDAPARFYDQLRNVGVALLVMWIAAQISPQTLLRAAVPVYGVGVCLLIAVFLFGVSRKGATRWLYIGVTTDRKSVV